MGKCTETAAEGFSDRPLVLDLSRYAYQDVEGGPNPGHFDAAESGFEHRRSKGQKAAMQLNNRAFWRFTNQASDRRGGLVLLRPVAWIWTALYTIILGCCIDVEQHGLVSTGLFKNLHADIPGRNVAFNLSHAAGSEVDPSCWTVWRPS